ncbi:hypothetical protein FIBSPDRAFT_921454 [Athelia psychrophila]|uniref:Uncharacterized protein n=1 Tax=Athelia psychrophila TaxID=1759441 RepID=A0A166CVV4_9AGAM|nr:hypothetical protein FIBSPDRAFT_921454 [Fibularhizoctonia sp. CBS 109695]
MRLALLLVSLSLLQGCIAPAVSNAIAPAKYASPFPDTTSSLDSSSSTSNTCDSLNNCRSLVGIVTSCLATIFACVWVAVHPNVPGPKQDRTSRYFESFKLVVVTLLVPEWVLAWAVRQFLQARKFRDKLESASIYAAIAIGYDKNTTHERNTRRASSGIWRGGMSVPHNTPSKDGTGSVREARTGELEIKRASPVLRRSRVRSMPELREPARKLDLSWTITHGFLMTMGGFHSYRGGQPTCPLDVRSVLALVRSRSLAPPTSVELRDRSKGDALSKTIAILQTLWFVAQCIARRVENLAITNLEIVTLAYTAITVAMYTAWWHKPLNMHCPVRRVPTFWSSCYADDGPLPLYADIIALSVAMVFGAVHCAAWSFAFPSLEQQKMWRVCAIAIAAIPLPMAVAFAVFNPFHASYRTSGFSDYAQVTCMALGALLYIPARMILLVLSFTTLRQLPLSAYQTVQWTTWIPHV